MTPTPPPAPLRSSSTAPRSRRRTFKNVALFSLAVFGLSGLAVLVTQLWTSKATSVSASLSSAPIAVEMAQATVGLVQEVVHAVGTLEANESIMVRPELAGLVTRVLFDEGQAVDKGMVLIELDDSELQAHLAEAKAQLKIARLTYDRMMQLTGNQNPFISEQQIDQAISSLAAAEANYSLYQTRLAKTRIRAPFAGYVGIRKISPGDYVQPGQDLINLEDLRTLKIDFKVPETYMNRLAVGQQIRIATDVDPTDRFGGEIYVIDPRVDAGSRAIHVRARVPNAGVQLRPGLFANVELVLREYPDALLIPEDAVVPQRDRSYVYRVLGQTARWTEIHLGIREKGAVQILEGLQPGDTVVHVGHHKLKDGTTVQAK